MPRGIPNNGKHNKGWFKKGHPDFGTQFKNTTGIKNPKKRHRFTNQRYKARKRNAEGSHTIGEWELLRKQYGFTCPACGKKEPEITLSEDHIIPLFKGGSDFIENIQPLCVKCNCKKRTRIIKF